MTSVRAARPWPPGWPRHLTPGRWRVVFWELERDAHYNWRVGVRVGLTVAAPLLLGLLTDQVAAGSVAGIAAWLLAIAPTAPTGKQRCWRNLRRAALLSAGYLLGLVAGTVGVSQWWLAAIFVAALGALTPVRWIAITPLICLIVGLDPPAGLSFGAALWCFSGGCLWAALALLIPIGGRHPSSSSVAEQRLSLRQHVRQRTPELRHGGQVAVLCTGLFVLLTVLEWPHAGWLLVGVLTTLRPSWAATEARVVKRNIGMAGGALLTAAALAIGHHSPAWATAALIAVLGAAARPLRQLNYGFWPVLGTPTLLLLVDLGTRLDGVAPEFRLLNNLLGAAFTLLAVTVLWPHPDQRPPRREPSDR